MRTGDWVMIGHSDCVTDIVCALRWGVALVGDISIGLYSPRRGITLSGTREDDTHSRL